MNEPLTSKERAARQLEDWQRHGSITEAQWIIDLLRSDEPPTPTSKEQAIEAMEHVLRVFNSLADRGHYPRELLRYVENEPNPHFLGKQGWEFLTNALAALRADEPPAPSSKTLVEALENYCHCNQAVDFKCLPCRSRDEIERLTECLRQANEGFEKYERLYYLEQQKNEGDSDEPPVNHRKGFAYTGELHIVGHGGAIDGRWIRAEDVDAQPPAECNHGAIAPKGTMFYHGFVDGGVNHWRCDSCKGIYAGNLTEPNKPGSQALTLLFQPPLAPHPEAVIAAAARVETELTLAASFVADLRTLIAAVRAPETKPAAPVAGVVPGSNLEKQIQSARNEIATWPPNVKRAIGVSDETGESL